MLFLKKSGTKLKKKSKQVPAKNNLIRFIKADPQKNVKKSTKKEPILKQTEKHPEKPEEIFKQEKEQEISHFLLCF